MTDPVNLFIALGGLGGLGATLTALASLITAVKVKRDTRLLLPDHGNSVADKINRIEKNVEVLTATVQGLDERTKSIGHQVGEIRRDLSDSASDHDRRLDRLDSRMSKVEDRSH